jgi:cytochrome b involved in lipid metabolism
VTQTTPTTATDTTQRQFTLSEIAVHNGPHHGYWLVIDRAVYDVSAFMHSHPGGPRILQLYAGRDATSGFARVHAGRTAIVSQLRRYRIGTLAQSCLEQPAHACHHATQRAFASTLQLVVEMQNALVADHSFCVEPPTCRYELQRALETHARFQVEYLQVLIDVAFPRLLGVPRRTTSELAFDVFARFERLNDSELSKLVATFTTRDRRLLCALKRELRRGLRVFEQPHQATLHSREQQTLEHACWRIGDQLGKYFERAE